MNGEDGEETLRASSKLAHVLKQQGEIQKALAIFQDVGLKREVLLGRQNPETLQSLHDQADMLQRLARYQAADHLFRKVLRLRSTILGPDHADTTATKSGLAVCLRSVENVSEALILDQEVLAIKNHAYGPDSLKNVDTVNALALDYLGLEQFDQAEEQINTVIRTRQQELGAEHEETLCSMFDLGRILQAKGDLDVAETKLATVSAVRTKLFGATHPATIECRNQLSRLMRWQDRTESAINEARECLSLLDREFGHTHRRTVSAQNFLATTQQLCEEFTQAGDTWHAMLSLRHAPTQLSINEHLKALGWYSMCLHHNGKFAEAEKVCKKLLKGRQVILGTEHSDTLFSAWLLVVCLFELNRLPEAERLCREAISLAQANVTKDSYQLVQLLRLLAKILDAEGKKADTLEPLESSLGIIKGNGAQLSSLQPDVLQDLIDAHYMLWHFAAARDYLQQYLLHQENTHGSISVEAAAILRHLGVVEYNTGNFHPAATYYERAQVVYQSCEKATSEDYEGIITSRCEALLKLNKRDPTARALCEDALALDSANDLSDNPSDWRLASRGRLARNLLLLERLPEAKALATSVVKTKSTFVKPDSIILLDSRSCLARIMASTPGQEQSALTSTREVLVKYINISGEKSIPTCLTAWKLGDLCGRLGKFWEGEMLLRGAWTMMEERLGVKSSWVKGIRESYAVLVARARLNKPSSRRESWELIQSEEAA